MSQRYSPLSRKRGITLNDWVIVLCLGFAFIFMAALILSFFLSVDPKSLSPFTITNQPVGFIILTLALTGLFDLGAMCVIWGWKGRHKASTISLGGDDLNINNPLGMMTDGGGEQNVIRSISSGMSGLFKIYLWAKRISAIFLVIILLLATVIWWLLSILDLTSGNKSLNGGILIVLGLVFVSYLAIIYFMLLKKPAATQNTS